MVIDLSLAPGFSRVKERQREGTVLTVSSPARMKPLKRLAIPPPAHTGLKHGANESLPETEMRPHFHAQPGSLQAGERVLPRSTNRQWPELFHTLQSVK
jgi:hypothetical protein